MVGLGSDPKRKSEKLIEAGLLEAHGIGRGRTYTLSAKVYRYSGRKAAYIRQVGFDPIQQEQMVLAYIDKHGSMKRGEVMDLCRITKDQAYNLLNRLKRYFIMNGPWIGANFSSLRKPF